MKNIMIMLLFLGIMPACVLKQSACIDKPFYGMFSLRGIKWGIDRNTIEQNIGRKLIDYGAGYYIEDEVCGRKCRIEFTICPGKGLISTRAVFKGDLSRGEAVCVKYGLAKKYGGDMETNQWVLRDGVIHFMLSKGMNAVYINRLDSDRADDGRSGEMVNCP